MRLWKKPSKTCVKRMNKRQQKKAFVGAYAFPIAELEIVGLDFDTANSDEFVDWMIGQYEANRLYGTYSFNWQTFDNKVTLLAEPRIASNPLLIGIKLMELERCIREIKPYKDLKFSRYRIIDGMWCDLDEDTVIYKNWTKVDW